MPWISLLLALCGGLGGWERRCSGGIWDCELCVGFLRFLRWGFALYNLNELEVRVEKHLMSDLALRDLVTHCLEDVLCLRFERRSLCWIWQIASAGEVS